MEKIKAMLMKLTFDKLREWAGESIFERGRKYIKNVDVLYRTEEGTLAAWVSGSERYATSVNLGDGEDPDCLCTCPYDSGPCKHAVAVILAAADYVKQGKNIPLPEKKDKLFKVLIEASETGDNHDFSGRSPAGADDFGRIKEILSEKTKDELVDLFMDFAVRNPDIKRVILENEQLEKGQIKGLVSSLRREITKVTSESAWRNHWDNEGHLPDYSHIREQLQALLDKGYADEVVELGEELWEEGSRQVEESDDEGDVAGEISECMEIVFRAASLSSMVPSEQILWRIDRLMEDEFAILDSFGEFPENDAWHESHWREVAEKLELRLKSADRSDSGYYRRKKLLDQLLEIYELGGWQEKIIPLMEKEADICKNYDDLVRKLLEAGKKEKARQWCRSGFERTVREYPGIASRLQNQLREMASEENRHDLVASYLAQDFFERPSVSAYGKLLDAAEKAGNRTAVRKCAIGYLETGKRPDIDILGETGSPWPLPETDVMRPLDERRSRHETFPDLGVLIDIAILEERFDDVVDLYRKFQNNKYRRMDKDRAVADAVSKTHPRISLEIWRSIVDGLIAQVKPKAYEEAAVYLRLMRKVYYESNCSDEWRALTDELRKVHKPKRKLMEVLDNLVKTSII